MAKQHTLTLVIREEEIVAVHVDCSDSNIDGNLRIYEDGFLSARYEPDEWDQIQFVPVTCSRG